MRGLFAWGVRWLRNTISLHLWCMVGSGNWILAFCWLLGMDWPPALGTLLSPALVSITIWTLPSHLSLLLFLTPSPFFLLLLHSAVELSNFFKGDKVLESFCPLGNQFVKNLGFGVHCSIPVVNIGFFLSWGKTAQDRMVELSLGREKDFSKADFFSFFSLSCCSNTLSFLYLLVFVTYAFSSFQSYSSIFWPLAFSLFWISVSHVLPYSWTTPLTLLAPLIQGMLKLWGFLSVWGVLRLFCERLLYCK